MFQASSVATEPTPIRIVNLLDTRLPDSALLTIQSQDPSLPFWPKSLGGDPVGGVQLEIIAQDSSNSLPLNLLRIQDGDSCSHCSEGKLNVQKAIELGHTFHLGTRYSEPMQAMVIVPKELLKDVVYDPNEDEDFGEERRQLITPLSITKVPIQMGCHGIGVSRIIGAVADTLADKKGLNWPRVMAPYDCVIIPRKDHLMAADVVLRTLHYPKNASGNYEIDVILDDRDKSFIWKLIDSEMIGYPVVVVMGKRWEKESMVEIHCRRLQVYKDIHKSEVFEFVKELLEKL